VEFAGNKIFDFTDVRRIHKRETVDLSIARRVCFGAVRRRGFANDKGEGEDQLAVVGKLQQKCGAPSTAGYLRVLISQCQQQEQKNGRAAWKRTWTNSTGELSPSDRDADTLVAGNAFGTMLIDVRFRGLDMTTEEIDTAIVVSMRAPCSRT
jgi:hypothetical protein